VDAADVGKKVGLLAFIRNEGMFGCDSYGRSCCSRRGCGKGAVKGERIRDSDGG
jgi:hypothetical protein